MTCRTSVTTLLGTFRITCDNKGLTRITLPGINIPAKKTAPVYPASAPGFLADAAQQITEYCEGRRSVFSLPLAPEGTRFQLKVWKIILAIPYGETMSYAEIAEKCGSKNKARAIGGAANANPLPLVIPCHRVVGSDGSLTGFAGGIELKQALLDLEQKSS